MTPQTTAYLLVALLRGLYHANLARMSDHHQRRLGEELSGCLYAVASSSGSSPEAVSKIMEHFGWGPQHESGHPASCWLPPNVAREHGLDGHEAESGALAVPWVAVAALLDIATIRAIARTSSPFLAACVVARDAPPDLFASISVDPPGRAIPRAALATKIATRRYIAFLRATQPIAHGDFAPRRGNVTAIRRELRFDLATGEPHEIPFISAASFRGQLRRAAVHAMLADLELSPREVEPALMNSLLSGGGLDPGSGTPGVQVEKRRRLRSLCPLVDAFGGVFDNDLLAGCLAVYDVLPLVKETAAIAGAMATPEGYGSLPPASAITVVRDGTRKPDMGLDVERDDRMIFRVEAIAAGTTLFAQLAIQGDADAVNAVTASAIAWAVRRFQDASTLGAKQAAGFGAVEWGPFASHEGALDEIHEPRFFDAHLRMHRDELRSWLTTGKLEAEVEEAPAARTTKPRRDAAKKKEKAS